MRHWKRSAGTEVKRSFMDNIPDPVWGYDKIKNGFSIFQTEQEWKDYIDVSGAISYLKHLQKELEDDFYPAYEAYNGRNIGYFALPRIIFPYITFLGILFSGKKNSHYAIDYMNKYLSKVNEKFGNKERCEFIYRVYRHGLAHTNMPELASENGKVFGWNITFDDSKHLKVDNNPRINGKNALLSISPKKLADEVIASIDEYIKDLETKQALFDNFKKGFLCMATASSKLTIPDCLKEEQW